MSLGWQDAAACAQVGGDMWFPAKGAAAVDVKKLCASCPVALQCLEYALSLPQSEDEHGIFGGLTVIQRRALRRSAA